MTQNHFVRNYRPLATNSSAYTKELENLCLSTMETIINKVKLQLPRMEFDPTKSPTENLARMQEFTIIQGIVAGLEDLKSQIKICKDPLAKKTFINNLGEVTNAN